MSDRDKIKKSRRRSLRALKHLLHASEPPENAVNMNQFGEEYGSVWLPESGGESQLSPFCRYTSSATVEADSTNNNKDVCVTAPSLSQPHLQISSPGPSAANTSLFGTPELFRCAQDEQAYLATPVGLFLNTDFVAHDSREDQQTGHARAVYQAPTVSPNKRTLQQKNLSLPLLSSAEGGRASHDLDEDRVGMKGMFTASSDSWSIPHTGLAADYNSPAYNESENISGMIQHTNNLASTIECDAEYFFRPAAAPFSGCLSASHNTLLHVDKTATVQWSAGLQSSLYMSQDPGLEESIGYKSSGTDSVADVKYVWKENQQDSPVSTTDTCKLYDHSHVDGVQSVDLDSTKIVETMTVHCRPQSSAELTSDDHNHAACVDTSTDFIYSSMSTMLTSNDTEVTSIDTEVQQYLQSDCTLLPAANSTTKQMKKAKKERRRSFFEPPRTEESCADHDLQSNVDSVCMVFGHSANSGETDSELDTGLQPHPDQEQKSAVTSVKAKGSNRKRRSVDVALIEENTTAEGQPLGHECPVTIGFPTASGTVCRRSSLRLYRRPSHKSDFSSADITIAAASHYETENNASKAEFINEADAGISDQTVCSTVSQEKQVHALTSFESAAAVDRHFTDTEETGILPEVENLYRNKQYKKPQDRTWETIFESPSRGKLVSKQKFRRYLQFEKVLISKQKRRQKRAALNGWRGNRLSEIDNHDLLLKLESLQEDDQE